MKIRLLEWNSAMSLFSGLMADEYLMYSMYWRSATGII